MQTLKEHKDINHMLEFTKKLNYYSEGISCLLYGLRKLTASLPPQSPAQINKIKTIINNDFKYIELNYKEAMITQNCIERLLNNE